MKLLIRAALLSLLVVTGCGTKPVARPRANAPEKKADVAASQKTKTVAPAPIPPPTAPGPYVETEEEAPAPPRATASAQPSQAGRAPAQPRAAVRRGGQPAAGRSATARQAAPRTAQQSPRTRPQTPRNPAQPRTPGGILSAPERARNATRATLLKELNHAATLYQDDVGSFPARLTDVAAPPGSGPRGYNGPYTTPQTWGNCAPLPCDPVSGQPFRYDPKGGKVTAP